MSSLSFATDFTYTEIRETPQNATPRAKRSFFRGLQSQTPLETKQTPSRDVQADDPLSVVRRRFADVSAPPPAVVTVDKQREETLLKKKRIHELEQSHKAQIMKKAEETQRKLANEYKQRQELGLPNGSRFASSSSTTLPSCDGDSCSVRPNTKSYPPPTEVTRNYTNQEMTSIISSVMHHLQINELHTNPETRAHARAFALEMVPQLAQYGVTPEQPATSELPIAMAFQLCSVFKKHFEFVKFNDIPCEYCGGMTLKRGVLPPDQTDADPIWLCSRAESYHCPKCDRETLFYRCNNPSYFLDPSHKERRKGRCGEFANIFTLLCSSVGFVARIAVDVSPTGGDHVWTEVYDQKGEWSSLDKQLKDTDNPNVDSSFVNYSVQNQPRYIHFDSCEGFGDCPLVYEQGWNKSISLVVGINNDGCYDITRRYTVHPVAALPRELSENFARATASSLKAKTSQERVEARKRRSEEIKEIEAVSQHNTELITKYGKVILKEEEKHGRISGQ
ncbi:putative peptide-N4-(N-acetyl-beta-glucosaminyl)asparagine amidase [Blattamonas nauphoetae]|uniref:Peptide-N4-(N-acetyl-beta-glucosaminyl)asparagine amidase n=1 Tax=Blattamonas nauphoetae TaxID=2049346 RepID=A0ABQ9YCU2_9EUKA|nr:putative peptide-N4-(N-acetyl-beta-glucosaminyl)asparagine amidase [Blattamonas nauphoetae]